MRANQKLRHRRQLAGDLGIELGEADLRARAEDAVFDREAFERALLLLAERVIGGAQIGELGLAALGRNLARRRW